MSDDRPSPSPSAAGRHVLIALLLACAVAVCFHFVDRPVAVWAHGLSSQVVVVFKEVTKLGGSGPYLIGLAAAYLFLRLRLRRQRAARQALFALAAIAVSGLTADLVKVIVGRWRPVALFAQEAHYGYALFSYGYEHNSFPSGHATTAGALACVLTLLYPRWRTLWVCAAALVAVSRVFVGAHYPGDVIAGFWLGVVVSLGLARWSRFRSAVVPVV